MRRIGLLLLTTTACGPKSADDSGDGSATDGTTVSASATETTSTSAGSATTGGDNPCEALPWHGCLPVGNCDVEACGTPGAGYDENGCLRDGCGSDAGCYEGEVCFHPIDWGGCASSSQFCELDPFTGECFCGGTDDCNGSYCALEGSVPSPECLVQTEEAPCLDLGCNAFVQAYVAVLGPMGCECQGPVGTCLYVPGEVGGDTAFTAYWRTDGSDEVRWFPTGWFQDPVGWIRCYGNADEPASCTCSCP